MESDSSETGATLSSATLTDMNDGRAEPTRREQYALATQQAIIDAARKLFAERGYFATKVEDIALEANVSPATVYASAGGKQGLLDEMSRLWATDPAIEIDLDRTRASTDPHNIIAELASTVRQLREQWADVIRVLLTTAPHDPAVAAQLEASTQYYRECIANVAQRLSELGTLRHGIDSASATDILWFYFGYGSLLTLHDENGWTYDQAERWLADRATQELIARS
jgi:AcrR family transcriptional regulator